MSKYQHIYISFDGKVIDSCNSIIKLKVGSFREILDKFPILESCWPYIFQVENQMFTEFSIGGVCINNNQKNQYFDFHFIKIILNTKEALYWLLEDKTQYYLEKQKKQQFIYEKKIIEETLCDINFK